MGWKKASNHINDCDFCLEHVAGISSRTLLKVEYLCIPSAIRPASILMIFSFQFFKVFFDAINEFNNKISIELILPTLMLLKVAVAKISNQNHLVEVY